MTRQKLIFFKITLFRKLYIRKDARIQSEAGSSIRKRSNCYTSCRIPGSFRQCLRRLFYCMSRSVICPCAWVSSVVQAHTTCLQINGPNHSMKQISLATQICYQVFCKVGLLRQMLDRRRLLHSSFLVQEYVKVINIIYVE